MHVDASTDGCVPVTGTRVMLQSRDAQLRRRGLTASISSLAILWSLGLLAGRVQAAPPLPVINTNLIFDVTNTVFAGGALGNGVSNSAAAIQAAINMASTASASGATVRIRAVGANTNYLSGPFRMASHVNLMIDSGTKLQMLPKSSWPNVNSNFIYGATLTDAEISGKGTIDGQGTNWWFPLASSRPNFIQFDHCTRVLIQDVTLQNPPTFTIYLKNSDTSVTIQGITINTPFDSHNTDAFDISSTNVLIQNSFISTGDDDVEIGGSGAAATDITISNCTFGTGHGVSIGSKTGGGVNNLIVSNCWWTGTEYGIKIKTDRADGGLIQNLKYCDLNMTNVNFPIAMYMDYDVLGSPSKSFPITPANAAADTTESITSSTPFYRNITISNLTAVGNSGIQGPGNVACFIYGLPESPVTNVTLTKVNILGRNSGDGTFCIYHARGIKIIDSNLTAPTSGTNTLTLYNAQVIVTNSAANANLVTITGLGSPSNSVLSLFNGQASMGDASVLGANPLLTLAGSTLTVSNNNMSVGSSSSLNFGLGTNVTKTVVTGNLTLGGTLNVADGGGFNTGTYTLFSYGGTLTYNGLTSGTTPNTNFTYKVDTNTTGVVKLDVTSSCSVGAAGSISGSSSVAAGTNGVSYSISGVGGATTYAWTVPTGATIAGGQGTTSITVNYGCSAVSGNVAVTPSNGSCNGTLGSLAVTVTGVGAAGSISGPGSVAAGMNGVSYSISSVGGATTYAWTVPSGVSIASGQGTTSITVNYSCSAVSGNVQVTPGNANGCSGTSASLAVTVTGVDAAGSISGLSSLCAGSNGVAYSISSVNGATSYTWAVPAGASIASGQGSTSIAVNWGSTSGLVTVTPVNANSCSGTVATLSVTVNPLPTVFNVTGGGTFCNNTNGVPVGLDGSQSGVNYQLLVDGNPTNALVSGTGDPLSFGNQTTSGNYTVVAVDATTGCTMAMNGSAALTFMSDPFQCWQLQYFGCTGCPQADGNADPDGDGMSNTNEFLSGTDPTNNASVLRIISTVRQTTDVVIVWTTAGGHTNAVQANSGDANGNYTTNFVDITTPPHVIIPGSGDATNTYVDGGAATNGPSRFYRIRLVP